MVQVLPQNLTLNEFLQFPETKPASEFIDGKIIQKPMPKGKHSKLQTKLVTWANLTLEEARIAQAFTELRCTFGDRSIVPDIAVFTWEHIPTDEAGEILDTFTRAPDWAIEILSPNQSPTRVTRNLLHCLEHGCQMGWFVDAEERSVVAYPAGRQAIFLDRAEQGLPMPAFAQGLHLSVGELFGWLQVR